MSRMWKLCCQTKYWYFLQKHNITTNSVNDQSETKIQVKIFHHSSWHHSKFCQVPISYQLRNDIRHLKIPPIFLDMPLETASPKPKMKWTLIWRELYPVLPVFVTCLILAFMSFSGKLVWIRSTGLIPLNNIELLHCLYGNEFFQRNLPKGKATWI